MSTDVATAAVLATIKKKNIDDLVAKAETKTQPKRINNQTNTQTGGGNGKGAGNGQNTGKGKGKSKGTEASSAKKTKKAAPTKTSKMKAKTPAKGKGKGKQVAMSKNKKVATNRKTLATFAAEWSRSRVRCRGPDGSWSVSFAAAGSQAAAIDQCKRWCMAQNAQ